MTAKDYKNTSRLFVALFLLLGTGNGCVQRENAVDFSLAEATAYQVEQFDVQEKVEIGHPGMVSFWDTETVIVADRVLPSLLSLVNLHSGETKHFLKMGRGPGECLDINTLTVQDKKIYVFSPSSKKIIVLHPAQDEEQRFALAEEATIEKECVRVIPTKKGGYIGTPIKGDRFLLFDRAGFAIESHGSFPAVDGAEEAINNNTFQSRFAFSPDGKHFCSAYHDMDFVEIYSGDFRYVKRLWGPEPFIPTAKKYEREGYNLYVSEPQKEVYYMISTSNCGFIVGYVGHLFKDRNDPSRCTKELHYFDWNGNFLARYILPQEVAFFDVDWENGRLCGVTFEAEPKLVLAELEGL